MNQLLAEKKILFGEDETKLIELKVYAKEFLSKLPSVIELDGRKGPNELKRIFDGKAPFNNPKPSDLILELLTFVSKPNDIVLDFFAGSGTTAHAVLKLNKQDGGRRRFIMASSTEAILDGTAEEKKRNLCRDVCAERIRRVMTLGDGDVGPFGGSFTYLKAQPILRHRLELELDNQTIWNAVLLLHDMPVSELDGSLGWVVLPDGCALSYPTGTKQKDVTVFAKRAERFKGPVFCYAWAVARFETAVPRATVYSLPDTLLKKFRRSAALLVDDRPPTRESEAGE